MRIVIFAAAATFATTSLFAQPAPDRPIALTGEAVVWKEGPPSLPKGSKMAVLEGNPRDEGMFTMRLLVPAGSAIPPHWHPRHERVTILSGAVDLGFGNVADQSKTKRYAAGSFYVNPPRVMHYLFFPQETLMQMTGVGPWELHTDDITPTSAVPATATISIRSISPAPGTKLKSGDKISVIVDYDIRGFRPSTFFLRLAFESTTPNTTVGAREVVRRTSGAPTAPPRPRTLTESRGTAVLTEDVDNVLATANVRTPLRVRVFVQELTGEMTSHVAAMSDWIDYR